MAEILNTNVFPVTVNGETRGAKFVDFAGLDYFWSKVKAYVDGVDTTLSEDVAANAANIATNSSAISSIQDELNSLSGGAGSIATQINNAIAALKLPETYETIANVSSHVTVLTEAIATAKAGAEATAAAALKGHADNTELHVTKDKQDAWDAAASAINTFLDDNAVKEGVVDTLKEIQTLLAEGGEVSSALLADVAQNKKDIATNSTAIGSVVTKMGEDIATAKSEAISAAAEDATSKANTAKSEAISAAAEDATSKANTAKSEAIAQAQKDAQEFLKSYYTSAQVDTKLSETLATAQGYANTAETNAKNYAATYTNELFNSITFVTDSEIDGLFTPATGE